MLFERKFFYVKFFLKIFLSLTVYILRKILNAAFLCYSKFWLHLLKIQGLQASKDKVESNDGNNKLLFLINILSQHGKKYFKDEYQKIV